MSVNVDRDFLRDKHIPEDTLYLGLSECGVNGGNASHVQLVAAWDECDTVLLSVRPMTSYSISCDQDGGLSVLPLRARSTWKCSEQNVLGKV